MRRFVLLCVALTMTATLSACADYRHRHHHGGWNGPGAYDRPGMRGEGMMNGRPNGMMGPGAMGGGPRGY